MNNTGVIIENKKKMKQLNPFLASSYKPYYKGKQMNTLLEKTGDTFYYWVTLPPEVAFTFCSDLSNAYQVPDTAGLILDLLNLTSFTDTSALLATSPLVQFLTAEVEIQDNSGVGRSGTYISADLLDALNEEFDSKVSDNVTSFFAPLKNFKLHSLDTSNVNSSEVLQTATNNFLTRAGSSATIPATDKPSVYAIKVAVKELASQYDSVTRQFEKTMNFILKKLLGFSYEWRIHIFGDIFSIDEQKSLLTRDDLKDLHLYMDIARYKAATLISDYSYRTYVLGRIKPTKYSELIRYNVRPYFGDITRKEFLVLMYSLLSDKTNSEESIMEEFYESGVLQGYVKNGKVLELDRNLTYAEEYEMTNRIIQASKELLTQTWKGNAQAVAQALDVSHIHVTSNRSYNNEDALQSAIYLAYLYALNKYTIVKEMTAGKGFADVVFIPYVPDIPAMIIELKHNKSAESALDQIREKRYFDSMAHYSGDLLFVGIDYDEKEKTHNCKIERFKKL